MTNDQPRYLQPMEIILKILNNYIEVANNNFKSRKWNINNIITYCGVHGINIAGSEKLMEHQKLEKTTIKDEDSIQIPTLI